ncbi:hypothetical protein N9Y42_08950 [Mariniblastus sp.]|nr:hypothetical protein [Mariniblastus sp.]
MTIDFTKIIQPLIGKPIAHAWKGYGSAIFFEIGELKVEKGQNNASGEHRIAIEWNWRVELGGTVLFGSSNTSPIISDRITELIGAEITSITKYGDIPELLVHLSTGHRIRTAIMVTGDPEWSIRVAGRDWLHVVDGVLTHGPAIANLTLDKTDVFIAESRIADRWGCPQLDPVLGNCIKCDCFIRLNGHGSLLDYGACTAPDSPFDGRIVNTRSGCPQFKATNGG